MHMCIHVCIIYIYIDMCVYIHIDFEVKFPVLVKKKTWFSTVRYGAGTAGTAATPATAWSWDFFLGGWGSLTGTNRGFK